MDDEAKKQIKTSPQDRLAQSHEADQREINAENAVPPEVFGYQLEEKMIQRARMQREAALAQRQISLASDKSKAGDHSDRASEVRSALGSGGRSREASIPLGAGGGQKGEVEQPQSSVSQAPQADLITAPVNPAPGYRAWLSMAAVGALVIGVVLINGWYLERRIDANTQRLNGVTGDPLPRDPETPATSAELARVLDLARNAFNAGLLVEPAGESAIDFYRVALGLDPANQQAQAGIRAVTDQLLMRAEAALNDQQLDEAAAALQAVREIDAELPLLDLLEAQIARQRPSSPAAPDKPARVNDIQPTPVESPIEPTADSRSVAVAKPAPVSVPAVSPTAAPALVVEPVPPAETLATEPLAGASPPTVAGSKPVTEAPVRQQDAPVISSAESQPGIEADTEKMNNVATVPPEAAGSDADIDGLIITPPALAVSTPMSDAAVAPGIDNTRRPQPAGDSAKQAAVSKPVTLKRVKWVEPVTPEVAISQGLSGWVNVAFTVTPEGETEDVEVADSSPREVFDRAAIASVTQWQFEPPVSDGEPVSQRTMVRIRFVVSD